MESDHCNPIPRSHNYPENNLRMFTYPQKFLLSVKSSFMRRHLITLTLSGKKMQKMN